MQTPIVKTEHIPVSLGRSITLESISVTLDGYGTVECREPLLIHTNVIQRNARGLCAFCLEQRIIGDGWEEFDGYAKGHCPSMSDPVHFFLVCNKCRRLQRIQTILDFDGNIPRRSVFMKYARGDEWYSIDSVCYESD